MMVGHPRFGLRCFGKNIEANTDPYCKDCDSRGVCEIQALDEFSAFIKEYREFVKETGGSAG